MNSHLTVAEIEEKGIAWGDLGGMVALDQVVKDFALRFRQSGHSVLRDYPGLYLWIHDAIHGWLGVGPDVEGERCVRRVQKEVDIRTCDDFLTLIDLYRPSDFTNRSS